ncbi:hypothetical protein RQP46_007148 [Phenoliferia psychrophenolica]
MASTASLESVATPPVPPELIADIIDLTVELLIEEELHLESYVPLSNRFLLSASLVNRAWHPIATNALLQRGTIPTVANTGVAFSFPLLTHLATHLPLAQSFIMAGNLPSLSSLKILPAPLGAVETMDTPAEDIIRELMAKLPTLAKLKVPEVWASTAVREYCEAAGVELAVD